MTENERFINDINKHQEHLINIKNHKENIYQRNLVQKKLAWLEAGVNNGDATAYTEELDKVCAKNHKKCSEYVYNKSAFYWLYKLLFSLVVCGGIIGLILYLFNAFNEVVYVLGDFGIGGIFSEEELAAINESVGNTRIRQMIFLAIFGVTHIVCFLGILWQRTGNYRLKSFNRKNMFIAMVATLGAAVFITYGDYFIGYDVLAKIGEEEITFVNITQANPTLLLYPQIAYLVMSLVCFLLIFVAWLFDTKLCNYLKSPSRFTQGVRRAKAIDKSVYKNNFAKALQYMEKQQQVFNELLQRFESAAADSEKSCLFIKNSTMINFKDIDENTGVYNEYEYNEVMEMLSIARHYAIKNGVTSLNMALMYYEQDEKERKRREQERQAKLRAEEKARREAQERAYQAQADLEERIRQAEDDAFWTYMLFFDDD